MGKTFKRLLVIEPRVTGGKCPWPEPCWAPPPTAPKPMARHPGGGPPALFLPSPPRRWACGQSPERGARPLPPSDYSRCGGAIIAPWGPCVGGAAAGAQQLHAGPFRRAVEHFFCTDPPVWPESVQMTRLIKVDLIVWIIIHAFWRVKRYIQNTSVSCDCNACPPA